MGDTSATDWASAISSVIAATISIITVTTVYVAARQLLTEHRAYQMGLSQDTLGPWHDKVKKKQLQLISIQVATGVIPNGFMRKTKINVPHISAQNKNWIPAKK